MNKVIRNEESFLNLVLKYTAAKTRSMSGEDIYVAVLVSIVFSVLFFVVLTLATREIAHVQLADGDTFATEEGIYICIKADHGGIIQSVKHEWTIDNPKQVSGSGNTATRYSCK